MPKPSDPKYREAIFQAAYDLFLQHGYDGTSTAAIAKRARASTSHPFRFFKDKETMLEAVVRRIYDENHALIRDFIKSGSDFSTDEFVDRGFDALAEMRQRALFILHCTLTPKLTGRISEIFKEYNLGITDMFAPYLTHLPREDIEWIGDLLVSVSDTYFLDGDLERAKNAAKKLLDTVKNKA